MSQYYSGPENGGQNMKKTPFYAFSQFVGTWLYKRLYPHLTIGKENFPKEGKVVVCSNHISNNDPLFISFDTRRQPFYMAKIELFQNKFVGMILRALGAFAVERGSGGSDAMDRCKEILDQDGVVAIFIEGTRSLDGNLGKPKSGAVMIAHQNHAPILPVCITTPHGKPTKLFEKSIVSYGKLIQPEELGIIEGTGVEFRKASRLVMSRIAEQRERDQQYFQTGRL